MCVQIYTLVPVNGATVLFHHSTVSQLLSTLNRCGPHSTITSRKGRGKRTEEVGGW